MTKTTEPMSTSMREKIAEQLATKAGREERARQLADCEANHCTADGCADRAESDAADNEFRFLMHMDDASLLERAAR